MSTYTYGPVPSRRLGRSLGVDLVPLKTCDFNCVYCQLGPAATVPLERRQYTPPDAVVADVRQALRNGPPPDYVTLAGSGEPTLHSSFGEIASALSALTDVPVALLTNGSLFFLPRVRAACADVHLVLPSLDAGDEQTFRLINRPHPGLTLERTVEGLAALRREFAGQIWLEVFIVQGINASDEQVAKLKSCIERINPHRVQINTAVRPPAESNVRVPCPMRLQEIREAFGPRAEIIAPVPAAPLTAEGRAQRQEVLQMLRRRPCTVQDVAEGLAISANEAVKHVHALLNEGLIHRRQRLYETYYEPSGPDRAGT